MIGRVTWIYTLGELRILTPKELALKFFQEILELKDTKVSFVKAYCKSKPHEYEETIKLDTDEVKTIKVNVPGVMFVWLESEILHDQVISKARGLGGKYHTEVKYFVSSDKCEAVRAAKEHYKNKVQKIVTGNKAKEDAQKMKFYFHGQELFVAGKL